MSHLIDIAGITTLGTVVTAIAFFTSAINPVGAGLLIAGAVLWAKRNS
jgi:hypothetical protein